MKELTQDELVKALGDWLNDPELLKRTRRLLGGQGLSEMKIANWKRPDREIPDTLIEGAALDYCARATRFDGKAAERTKLVGEEFWQVFLVSSARDEGGNHDCTVFRHWTNVRKFGPELSKVVMTHKTWFTGSTAPEEGVVDLATGEPHEAVRVIGDVAEAGRGHELAISWPITGKEGRNLGYRVHLNATVASRPVNNQRHEYLGGLSIAPVERMVIVVSLPHTLLKKTDALLAESAYVAPQCLQFLADGIPIRILESFLQGKTEREWLAPWFDLIGPAKHWLQARLEVPEAIRSALPNLEQMEGREVFYIEIVSPAPYLYYSMVFEMPEDAQ